MELERRSTLKKISIIIPCFNEIKTIEELLRRVENADFGDWQKEIIVVDDGSSDGTKEFLKFYSQDKDKNLLRVVYHDQNQGKGAAVKSGLKEAMEDLFIIQDADLEYDPNEILGLLRVWSEGRGEVIYGSRNLSGSGKHPQGFLIPRLGVWFITGMINLMYGIKLTDVWTCYKLFPREATKFFQGNGFEAELLFTTAAVRNGFTVTEVPISHYPRSYADGKKINYSDGLRAIFVLFLDRFGLWRQ